MPNITSPQKGSHFSKGFSRESSYRNPTSSNSNVNAADTAEFVSAYRRSRVDTGRVSSSREGGFRDTSPAVGYARATTSRDGSEGKRGTSRRARHHMHTTGAPQNSRRSPHRRRRVIAGILGAVAALVIAGGVCGFTLYNDAKSIMAKAPAILSDARSIKDSLVAGDGDNLDALASSLSAEVHEIKNITDGPAWVVASFVPVIGQDVSSARTLVSELDNLCQNALLPACNDLAGVSLGSLASDGAVNISLIQQLIATMQQVSPVVRGSAETIEGLPVAHIGQLEEAYGRARELMDSVISTLDAFDQIAPYLPQMLGVNGQTRNYLIVAETNSEIRATGGLPGSLGVLSITDGTISLGEFVSLSSFNEYSTDNTDITDEELNLFGEVYRTLPSSATFNPDWPRSASLLCQVWTNGTGQHLDGAISLDPVFLQQILTLTPSFTASNGVQIDGTNAARLLLHDAYQFMSPETTDTFFSEVADMAFNNIMGNLGNIDLGSLLNVVSTGIEQRRLIIWMANEQEEAVMERIGCSGEVSNDETRPELGVYLNDVTWSKISWYLSAGTQIGEGIVNADGTTTYHVTTTLKNNLAPGEADTLADYITGYNPDKRSRDDMIVHVLVMAPAGASITNWVTSANNWVDTYTYEGHQAYMIFTQMQAGEVTTLDYDVTVSARAIAPLTVDATPTAQDVAGWGQP